ncbi:SPOR domain-containing protein [Leptolyngbya sp. FACHB-261]|uniref:SPOR domain-containing protein n=1 Tax=Leptolyngbya sp. FACHB-261 TaxID=2692806 RepID=UPI001689E4AA|nr:SPOR domain-containing protein [Leptolyngbya sp. FACHB-261]MBD2099514.1 SPOR domain-containing protein [Leptolyngbya sp. FACHB-261]
MSSVNSASTLDNGGLEQSEAASEAFPLRPVLASLDVELESELDRYRQWREGQPGSIAPVAQGLTQPAPLAESPVHRQPPIPPLPAGITAVPALSAHEPELQGALPDSGALSSSLGASQAFSGLEGATAIPALDAHESMAYPAGELTETAEDLRSSDELLRSLTEEETEEQDSFAPVATPGFFRGLLTPVGVASLLLLMCSSAVIGFLLVDRGNLSRLGWQQSTNAMPETSSSPLASEPAPNAQSSPRVDVDTLNQLRTSTPAAPNPSVGALTPMPSAPIPGAPGTASQPVWGSTPLATANSAGSIGATTSLPNQAPPNQAVAIPRQPGPSGAPAPRPLSSNLTQRRPPVQALSAPSRPAPLISAASTPQRPPILQASPTPIQAPASRPQLPSPVAPVASAAVLPPVNPFEEPNPGRVAPPAPKLDTATASSALAPTASSTTSSTASAAARRPTASASASGGSGIHYVVMNLSSERSLNQARRVVGDAYVRQLNGQSYIQLGAFSDPENARKRANALQSAGLPAAIVEP